MQNLGHYSVQINNIERPFVEITRLQEHSLQANPGIALAVLIASASLLLGCDNDLDLPNLALSELTVQGTGNVMYPQFDKQILHFAIKCNPSDVMTLSATTDGQNALVSIDGHPPELRTTQVEIANPDPDQDIVVEVFSERLVMEYTLHCLAEDFPEIQVLRAEPETSLDLMLVSPRFRQDGVRKTYIIVLDNNGVPRFRRKIEGSASDFKRHANGLYSYAFRQANNQFGVADFVIVILDEDFNEIDRLETSGLTQTDGHDFIFTNDGSRIFISYNSTNRDMSAFGLAVDEIVGDSVIQEVTPDGQVVFQWNSWDHIDLADCQKTGYPRFASDYAHLNSTDLTVDGDLIASFRGCGQILKIDRPTGDVIWRMGGSRSDFLIVGDSFNEFCGQHTALEIASDRILMFDNGNYCAGDREIAFGQFSRVVEYRLDVSAGQAHFVRDHSLNGTYQEFTRSTGSVQLLANGNWLISWGRGPDMSITEVDPSGAEIFAMKILFADSIAVTYRAFREPSLPRN